jgi:hypothetical protein
MIVYFYTEDILARASSQSCRNTPSRLSATASSECAQLCSVTVGRLLHPKPEDAFHLLIISSTLLSVHWEAFVNRRAPYKAESF